MSWTRRSTLDPIHGIRGPPGWTRAHRENQDGSFKRERSYPRYLIDVDHGSPRCLNVKAEGDVESVRDRPDADRPGRQEIEPGRRHARGPEEPAPRTDGAQVQFLADPVDLRPGDLERIQRL